MIQHVTEGAIVNVSGHEMRASNVREVIKDGCPCVEFTGTCTVSPRNDDIRGTGYDGGTYGGNHLVYTWGEMEYTLEVYPENQPTRTMGVNDNQVKTLAYQHGVDVQEIFALQSGESLELPAVPAYYASKVTRV